MARDYRVASNDNLSTNKDVYEGVIKSTRENRRTREARQLNMK